MAYRLLFDIGFVLVENYELDGLCETDILLKKTQTFDLYVVIHENNSGEIVEVHPGSRISIPYGITDDSEFLNVINSKLDLLKQ